MDLFLKLNICSAYKSIGIVLPVRQGHPMDLFLKISVLQAHFCWLGDVEVIICP